MAERWKIEVDARDAKLLAGGESQEFFARRRRGAGVDVKGDARVGHGELDSGEMNDVAPDQERIAAGLDKPGGMTWRMTRGRKGPDAWGYVVAFRCADSFHVG